MKIIITIFLFLHFGSLFSQYVPYPYLIKESKNINDFIPENWMMIAKEIGDLNYDKVDDVAFVLEYSETIFDELTEEEGDTITNKPRILGILFRDKVKDNYVLIEQNNSFITNRESPYMIGPFGGIKIENNIMTINFNTWFSMGSWLIFTEEFKFRYNYNNDFDLIEYSWDNFHRATHDLSAETVNYITQKICYTTRQNGEETKVWRTFKLETPITLKVMERPFELGYNN